MAVLIVGITLFLVTALDITKTTLSTRGGGMLTNGVSRLVWRGFFLAAGRKGTSRLLEYAGQCVLVSVLLLWIGCLWLSLFLMFASHPGSVENGTTKIAADLWETFYYAGFTLSTLGVGDYAASGDGWRVLTSAAAFCGLTLITAAITYVVPVLSAVSLQNQLSLLVSSMGRTPEDILANSWNGQDFSSFYDNATDIRQMLVEHTLNHHAYPVIRCFHISHAEKNIVPAIVMLAEVLRLLDCVSPQVQQDKLKRRMLGDAVDQHLRMQCSNYLGEIASNRQTLVLDLASLTDAGVPLDLASVRQSSADERQAVLHALLAADGWHWDHVHGNQMKRSG